MKWRLIILYALCISGFLLSSCNSSDVIELESFDQLVIKLGPPDYDRNQFSFRVESSRSYGCDAFLTGRLVRGKAFLAMEVFGVVPGRAGCSWQMAGDLVQTVRFANENSFRLEIRYQKETDLYHLFPDGDSWTVEKLRNDLNSKIELL